MFKRPAQRIILCASVLACSHKPEGHEFVGHYVKWPSQGEFQPCGKPDTWWVTSDSTVPPETLLVFAQGPPPSQMFARLRGDTTGLGRYGPARAFPRQLLRRQTLALRPASERDCR